jgi:hypothetical protein
MQIEIPGSAERIPRHTKPEVNDRIVARTLDDIAHFSTADEEERDWHLRDLEEEWDIERTIAATDGAILLAAGLVGLMLRRPSRWLFLVPVVIGGFLLQHALVGWCALMPILRRQGIRTPYEIAGEKAALLR